MAVKNQKHETHEPAQLYFSPEITRTMLKGWKLIENRMGCIISLEDYLAILFDESKTSEGSVFMPFFDDCEECRNTKEWSINFEFGDEAIEKEWIARVNRKAN